MSRDTQPTGAFTGRHMLLIMLAFFGVIVAVNLTMAVMANTSWTGFVVRNSYIASQEFNDKVSAAREQRALGWRDELVLAGGEARLTLADKDGRPLAMDSARLIFRSPATDTEDFTVELAAHGMAMTAFTSLRDGQWVVEIDATVAGHEEWKGTRRVVVRGGRIR